MGLIKEEGERMKKLRKAYKTHSGFEGPFPLTAPVVNIFLDENDLRVYILLVEIRTDYGVT